MVRVGQIPRRFSCVRPIAALVVSSVLAGCSGAGSVLTPARGEAPLGHAGKGSAAFTIKIPHPAKHAAGGRGVRYISPATESLGVSITGTNGTPNPTGIPAFVNLTPTSTGCSSSLASTVCTAVLPLPPGTYDASLRTYDQTGGAGNLLSDAQNVAFTVVAGTANSIALTLGGIPASVVVAPFAPGYLRGGTGGLTLYGPGPQKLVIEALDADGNIIAGAGAPTLEVAFSAPDVISVPTGSANVIELEAKTSGSPAVVTPQTLQLAVTATAADGTQVSAGIPLRIAHSALYVSLPGAGAVDVFYDGNVASPNFQVTQGINGPFGLAVDTAGRLYVADAGNGAVTEYPAGSTTPSVTLSGSAAEGVAVDGAGTIYVANVKPAVPNVIYSVTEFPAGASSPSVTISNGLNSPNGVAVDAAGTLYVANDLGGSGSGSVTEYPAGSTSTSTPSVTITSGISYPLGAAVDAYGTLYVANSHNDTVVEYPAGSTSASFPLVTLNLTSKPFGLAVDAAGTLYVANSGNNSVTEYLAGSTSPSVTLPESVLGSYPAYVFAVPGPLTP